MPGPLDEPRLRRLIDVGRSFVAVLDPEALLDDVLAAAQEVTGARYAALGVLEADRSLPPRFFTRGFDAETQAAIGVLPQGRGLLGVLIDDPSPVRLDDLKDHPQSYGFPANHPPMRSFLGVPITVRGTVWGNLYLTEKAGGPFDAADEEALIILADWAAVAVENARLYADQRRRQEEYARVNHVLEATTAIALAIGAETDLDRVLELIVKRGRDLVSARTMFISLPEGDALRIAAAAGEGAGTLPGTLVPAATSTAGRVLADGRARRLGDEPLSVPVPVPAPDPDGTTSTLLVPLVFRGRTLGVLTAIDRPRPGSPFSAGDEEILVAFGTSAATAVATAQDVGERRLRHAHDSAERERRRWARELHDDTLQGLAGLRVRLAMAAARGTDPETGDALQELGEQMNAEIGRLRTLITELRPAALDELGLTPALESLAGSVAATEGLEIDLAVDAGGDRLAAETETAVYRLVQEALTNVVKHSGAERCAIEVLREPDAVVVRVRDDGAGIDEEALRERTGFGVTGMRERALLAGGTLHLRRGEGGGTELRARLPLRDDEG